MLQTFKYLIVLILALVVQISISRSASADPFSTAFADSAEHAVLLVIDGFSFKAWDYLKIPVLRKMAEGGTLVERDYLPPAAHPQVGAYAEIHSGSIPNPIMMSGTVFITRETGYLQESFYPSKTTAFVTNSLSYNTLSRMYHYVYQKDGADAEAVSMALTFMELGKPAFMRIHLQDSGGAGSQSLAAGENVPWKANIWAEGSPYRLTVERADSLVGEFVAGLERLGILGETAIMVLGDHGQCDTGWHPPECVDASITSIVLWGAGVRRGIRLPYAEHIDVTPTICALMRVNPPKTSIGRVIGEALDRYSAKLPPGERNIEKMLSQFVEYRTKMTDAQYRVERLSRQRQGLMFVRLSWGIRDQFYGIDRFSEWPRFGSFGELLEHNGKVLEDLNNLDAELRSVQ